MTRNIKIFIIHAKKYVARKAYIDKILRSRPYIYEFIEEGDAETLSEKVVSTYFTGKEMGKGVCMKEPKILSCALKHFLAYEKILADGLMGALILEDDAILSKNFDEIFPQTIMEYESTCLSENTIISYEDTRLRFVPRSQRTKGKYLYLGDRDRMTGAYFINRLAAQMILDEVKTNKCHLPIDLYHRYLLNSGKLKYMWCQPTIASQGSYTGKFCSTLSNKGGWKVKITWQCKLLYKKLLYNLR